MPTWTDGVTVYVDAGLSRGDQLVSVVVQASLLAGGSLAPALTSSLHRRTALARRYLAVEGHRALAAQQWLLPPPVCEVIDMATASRSCSPAESMSLAGGREEVGAAPVVFGQIRPGAVRDLGTSGSDTDTVGHRPARQDRGELRETDGEPDLSGEDADVLLSPVGGGGGLGRLLKKLFREGRSGRGGPPGADAPTHLSRRAGGSGPGAIWSTSVARIADGATPAPPDAIRYPEWDQAKQRYKADWCTVREVGGDLSEPSPFDLPDTHALRRPLAHLGTDLEAARRQMQGDDIDVDAAVEARVQALAGLAVDDRYYVDRLRRKRDLSVLILLDLSGSAGEPSHTGGPVYVHQRAAAAALTTTLQRLGDRVAVGGFRSQGRADVRFSVIKPFDDHFDSALVRGLGSFVPGGYTRLGAAIRHGTTVLEQQAGTSRRLLVVLSDGLAYDHGYERTYGEADARHALAEARGKGVGCLCLSVGARTSAEDLQRVFGTAAYAAVARVEQLPSIIGPLFRTALRSAEQAQRTTWQRQRSRARLSIEGKVP